jgi:hypothetical protein
MANTYTQSYFHFVFAVKNRVNYATNISQRCCFEKKNIAKHLVFMTITKSR